MRRATTPDRVAAVHLDLDGAAQIYHLRGWRYDETRDPLFESGLPHALTLFAELGVRATLFVIAEDLRDPVKLELLRDAVRQGHDIASHTVTHRRLASLGHDDKRREIVESKESIERELGVVVDGFRAPDYSIDRESLELIAQAGYRYDSSVVAGGARARSLGLDSEWPGYALQGQSLLELPLPVHLPLPFPAHASYSLVLGSWYFRVGLRRARAAGAPLVLLFHLTDFADPLPRRLLAGSLRRRLFTLSHLEGARKRAFCRDAIEFARASFRLVPTGELLARSPIEQVHEVS